MASGELLEQLRGELLEVAATGDPTERLLEVAAIISDALRGLGIEPVVVGGLALAYWSDSAFATGDIDVVMERPPGFSERLEALGFRQDGRVWLLEAGSVAFEAPSEALEPGDRAESAELPSGRRVLILSPEDLLLWRLREWVYWGALSGFRHAAHLLSSDVVDQGRLDRRAEEEGLGFALIELRRVSVEIKGGRNYQEWELAEIAETIERASYSPSDEQP